MDLKALLMLHAAGCGRYVEERGYEHEHVKKITFIGNPYAWLDAQVTDKLNLVSLPDMDKMYSGVHFEVHDNIAILNGTAAAANDYAFYIDVSIPAGSYIYSIAPHVGVSYPGLEKNMRIFFYREGETEDFMRLTLSVKDTVVSQTFTLAEDAARIRVTVGVREGVYEDYRLFINLFDWNVSSISTHESVPVDGSLEYTFETEQPFVYSMQHESVVLRPAGG